MKNTIVKISNGNSKMGEIKSVSLPPVTTCRPGAPCIKSCYARRLLRYPNVRNAYEHNLNLYYENPTLYFDDIKRVANSQKFFRFHVSGDIPDLNYLFGMCDVAESCPTTKFLCFTKKYEIVNEFLFYGNIKPSNLIIIFSQWDDLYMPNPYELPVAVVVPKSEKGEYGSRECTGNCLTCAINNKRCWSFRMGNNDVVYLVEH